MKKSINIVSEPLSLMKPNTYINVKMKSSAFVIPITITGAKAQTFLIPIIFTAAKSQAFVIPITKLQHL